MEPVCHVDLVLETEGLVFVCYSHNGPVTLNSAASNLHLIIYRNLQHGDDSQIQMHMHGKKQFIAVQLVILPKKNNKKTIQSSSH